MGLWDEAPDHLKPRISRENRIARFILADFKLYLVGFRLADIGRIGNNEIERAALEALKQIGLMESNSIFEVEARRVGAGDLQGCR